MIGVGTSGVCTEPFDALLTGRQVFADTVNGALDRTYHGPLIHCSASYGGSAP